MGEAMPASGSCTGRKRAYTTFITTDSFVMGRKSCGILWKTQLGSAAGQDRPGRHLPWFTDCSHTYLYGQVMNIASSTRLNPCLICRLTNVKTVVFVIADTVGNVGRGQEGSRGVTTIPRQVGSYRSKGSHCGLQGLMKTVN
jgi:hypothetical protein